MTYITAHLPELEKLKSELEENPDRIEMYAKYDGFSSTHSGSIDYLDMKIKEYYKLKEND
jgi:hypothetical protein